MSKGSLMGKSVYNKRTGLMGNVVGEDGLTLMIDTQGIIKSVTRGTFTRWFTVVEDDPKEETVSKEPESAPVDESPKTDEVTDSPPSPAAKAPRNTPSGEKGVGEALCEKFLYLLKDMANQDLDITFKQEGKYIVVKYNGKNVFELSVANRRLSVFSHPNSLTPTNKSLVTKMFPKEGGWFLRAKFVFTSLDEVPLMKSIITDGLFYRQIKEE